MKSFAALLLLSCCALAQDKTPMSAAEETSGGLAQRSHPLPDAPVSQLLAQTTEPPRESPSPTAGSEPATATVPAGTRLQLVLTHPVDSNSTPRGDQVFAQTTAPVIVGDQVVIPGGTYVEGKVEKLKRRGTEAEMAMQSVSLAFPNGYVANAGGPVNIESEQWTAWSDPPGRTKAAIILAPILGIGLGTGIGAATDHAHTFTLGGGSMPTSPCCGLPGPIQPVPGIPVTENSHKGLVIGGMIGGIVGGVTSLALLALNHQFYIQEGSPMTMNLPQALKLTEAQIRDANQKAAEQPPPVLPPRPPGTQSPSPGSGNGPGTGPAGCSAGEEWCEGRCMSTGDFIGNDSNCGRCGNRCSFNESCSGTSCGCAAGYTSCMGQCVSSTSFTSDNSNCGSCGHSCSIGESCTAGTCMKIGH